MLVLMADIGHFCVENFYEISGMGAQKLSVKRIYIGFMNSDRKGNVVAMVKKLHREMQEFVTVNTTFEELYFYMNKFIEDNGYINLDFMGNLGHSNYGYKRENIYYFENDRLVEL